MSDWKMKRFWDEASADQVEGGFTVHLDGRPIRTPGTALLTVPTRAMAEAMAAELPVVASCIDGVTTDLVESGIHGRLIDGFDFCAQH